MLGGCCEPSPLTANSKSECDYCNYTPLCKAYGAEVRKRREKSVGRGTPSGVQFIAECMKEGNESAEEDRESVGDKA